MAGQTCLVSTASETVRAARDIIQISSIETVRISPVDIEQRIPGVLLMEQPNGGMITRATFLSGLPTGVSGNAGQICAPEASRRPMMMRCTSEVPSTICMILLERKILATG